jgi:hypothetical protein
MILATVLFCLASLTPARADLPEPLDTARFDWVCVTDASLTEAYQPLATHRRNQGLSTLILPLDQVILWSPAGDDTMATLRWLSRVAVDQWGAGYLVLGGSHALLPAPIHSLVTPVYTYDHPTDAYYACLDGEWDVDGDGLYAEWGQDAADPTVHIAVGRLPADDAQSVTNLVAKIIAFEERPADTTNGALFISSLMDPYWEPGGPYPNYILAMVMELYESALQLRPELRAGTIYQSNEPVDPYFDALNTAAVVDSLGARPHDLVHIQLHGVDHAWQLVQFLTMNSGDCDPLAGAGHSFIVHMTSGPVGDTRETNILQHLLTLPEGGAVAAVAPIGMGFLSPQDIFRRELWQRMLDGSCARLGDAFRGSLDVFFDFAYYADYNASTYWTQAILGDPATLLRPQAEWASPVPSVAGTLQLQAVPNPFNPVTSIRFEVSDRTQPVKVEIFDLQGRRLATLLEKPLPPGPHSVTWSGGAASGLYLARVTVGSRESTIKLTLVE